nr:hypothetical protein [Tissierella sp.]
MKKFKLLVLMLVVALGVTACSPGKDKDKVENGGTEIDKGADKEDDILKEDPKEEDNPATENNEECNEFLKCYYDNRTRKVTYESVTQVGDDKLEVKYYIDGDNYRVEDSNIISVYNSKDKAIYSWDPKTMSGTIKSNEQIPPHISDFQSISGLKVAELRDYEGEEQLYVESIGQLEGKDILAKSWISKKYYINLNGEATQDGKVISSIKSSNISEDFDSQDTFKKPEGVKFKEAR